MDSKRRKILLLWSGALFLVNILLSVLETVVFGQPSLNNLGTILALLAIIGFPIYIFVGYKVATAFRGAPGFEGKNKLIFAGVMVALFAWGLTSLLNLVLGGKISGGPGLIPFLGSGIGGYLAERKSKRK